MTGTDWLLNLKEECKQLLSKKLPNINNTSFIINEHVENLRRNFEMSVVELGVLNISQKPILTAPLYWDTTKTIFRINLDIIDYDYDPNNFWQEEISKLIKIIQYSYSKDKPKYYLVDFVQKNFKKENGKLYEFIDYTQDFERVLNTIIQTKQKSVIFFLNEQNGSEQFIELIHKISTDKTIPCKFFMFPEIPEKDEDGWIVGDCSYHLDLSEFYSSTLTITIGSFGFSCPTYDIGIGIDFGGGHLSKIVGTYIDKDYTTDLGYQFLTKSDNTIESVPTSFGLFNIEIGERIDNSKPHYLSLGGESGVYSGIIAGQPGKGKSVLIYGIILNGIKSYADNEIQFKLLNLKGVEYFEFENIKNISLLNTSEIDEATLFLTGIENEVKERIKHFQELKCRNIIEYNNKSSDKIPHIIVIIDEFQVLFSGTMKQSDFAEKILINKMVREWRAFGIFLLVCTQSLGAGVRKSFLDNIPLRIALGMTQEQSASFLNYKNSEASKLKIGQAIYNPENGEKTANIEFKTKYYSSEDIENELKNYGN